MNGCSCAARIALGFILLAFCAAPVPGDLGGCGQPVQKLDADTFFSLKKVVDCQRCRDCDFTTKACDDACSRAPPVVTQFPERCLPLVHDGEVCLRALLDDSCDDYAAYVRDRDPTVPTECNFCPEE